jgi:hypothetical protein
MTDAASPLSVDVVQHRVVVRPAPEKGRERAAACAAVTLRNVVRQSPFRFRKGSSEDPPQRGEPAGISCFIFSVGCLADTCVQERFG